MSNWLQKRLAVWMGVSLLGGALVWNVGALRAQSKEDPSMLSFDKPRLKFTREQAVKVYAQNLRYLRGEVEFRREDTQPFLSSVSSKSRWTDDFDNAPLEKALAQQWVKKRPFVMVNEGGYWGVDLVETYAKWNNLQGVAKAKAIFKLTGAVLADLPRDESFKRDFCQRNLQKISMALLQYSADYDWKYPPSKDWTDNISPYVKTEAVFNCPALPKGQRYGYAYNPQLASKNPQRYSSTTSKTTSVYETSILKRNALGTGENLAFRHQNGANYAFADGHVKWFPKTATPSFKLKP